MPQVCPKVNVLASGGLDEYEIANLEGAPNFNRWLPGVGTKVGVSSDAPWSESVYKMVDIDGLPVNKTSEGNNQLQGKKNVGEKRPEGMFLFDKGFIPRLKNLLRTPITY
ncbi:MAG: hypothetical protein CM1200mP3_05510 [Chloroflexota bacterium]|nr:MAG: hypothetical protein CM1200mP3_05510 [Chloroflexota bacterium]